MVALAEYGELVGESLERHPEEVAPIQRSLAQAERLGIELEICPSYLRLIHTTPSEHTTAAAADPEPMPLVATRQCADPWTFAYITSRGEVVPCCGSSRVMGDLRTQEFSSIWRGPAYRQFRQQVLTGDLPEECRSCVLKPPLHLRHMPHQMLVGESDHAPAPLLWGWHDRERHADGPFRWTASRAALLFEAPAAGRLALRLVWPGGGERPMGRIKVDGSEVARYRLSEVGEEQISVPCAPTSGATLVEIVSDNPRRPVPGEGLPDRRVLGVGVREVSLA
jgi:radical SAM protein with 4Fe4S-binding SPASM domain